MSDSDENHEIAALSETDDANDELFGPDESSDDTFQIYVVVSNTYVRIV